MFTEKRKERKKYASDNSILKYEDNERGINKKEKNTKKFSLKYIVHNFIKKGKIMNRNKEVDSIVHIFPSLASQAGNT